MSDYTTRTTLLALERDKVIRQEINDYFLDHNFEIDFAQDLDEAIHLSATKEYNIFLIEHALDWSDGLDFLKNYRPQFIASHFIISSDFRSFSLSDERIRLLQLGADAYIMRPIHPYELFLRISRFSRYELSLADRYPHLRSKQVSFGPYIFDLSSQRLFQGDTPIRLTFGERQLLSKLIAANGAPLSRESLIQEPDKESGRAIDVRITHLRKKIERSSKNPQFIQTVRGKGYALNLD